MRRAVLVMVAVALMACVLLVPSGDEADARDPATTAPTIPEGATVTASGSCGTASWTYVRGPSSNVLTVSDGNVSVRSDT